MDGVDATAQIAPLASELQASSGCTTWQTQLNFPHGLDFCGHQRPAIF